MSASSPEAHAVARSPSRLSCGSAAAAPDVGALRFACWSASFRRPSTRERRRLCLRGFNGWSASTRYTVSRLTPRTAAMALADSPLVCIRCAGAALEASSFSGHPIACPRARRASRAARVPSQVQAPTRQGSRTRRQSCDRLDFRCRCLLPATATLCHGRSMSDSQSTWASTALRYRAEYEPQRV